MTTQDSNQWSAQATAASVFQLRPTKYSIINAMSSAWSVLTSSAATEHETEALLQSTTIAHTSWDVVNRDKQTFPKEHNFVDWCRRIALHRTESTDANTAATEHDDLFKKLVKDILANELTA